MARTIEQIYNNLTLTKESNSELDSLLPNPDTYSQLYTEDNFRLLANTILTGLSISKVAVWRLLFYIVSFAIWTQEKLLDIFQDEVETTIIENQYGQLRWYPTISKEFQYGYELVWDGTKYIYETENEASKIITQAAASESSGVITVKVAKGILPNIVPLDSPELTSFIFYMKGNNSPTANDGIIPAGTRLDIISAESDKLKFAIELFYDPLILNDDGTLILTPSINPVHDAIYNFINTLPFDSIFKVISLVDSIQAVNGIKNVVVKNCDAKSAAAPSFTNVLNEVGQQYETFAGYLRMNTGNDLDEDYSIGVPTLKFIAA